MPLRLSPEETFAARLAGGRQTGMWVCSGSPLVAEICAGSGLDWLLIDAEHSPNGLESLLAQLQAVHGYPVSAVVRPPSGDAVLLKQYLDLGAQNLLIPMVDSAGQAAELVRAVRYPPQGIRGVGSALARASRWNRIDGYLEHAAESVTLLVQIESAAAVENVAEIAAVDGVDGLFLGPADLAASMGHLGQQEHPDVIAAVEHCIRTVKAAGKPVGVNAFAEATARRYIAAGVDFILVGADVALLARGSEGLAAKYLPAAEDGARASY
ncbi:HpcH/HpaI aldolase/citrate lyase family protein [Arthrobacter sp. zg-Y20]|uniref:HpcH/HpaI aldolase family protein n=1 Tax=unclassified Arthrobacter TaxID=235627 RepID=UPI001D15DEAF|nr:MULTISPECIES: HpcH/HpaI aldolase/citrate lyase family protein [unclassified Arthrobacter]MCC3275330.1 HpcH/HpaI aldolase/citrate lyase family protein [Arthrobacter sp. zg-Y20]MDK1315488.1 HpcH/HpaI aldolase/citrate lyase family protein [Arthrobacter sp. zg.Y20]WIB05904.1 HpcH/HpaI aldolase/citrate lyase family protein [Arthrobacter sp. zg-Y20]